MSGPIEGHQRFDLHYADIAETRMEEQGEALHLLDTAFGGCVFVRMEGKLAVIMRDGIERKVPLNRLMISGSDAQRLDRGENSKV